MTKGWVGKVKNLMAGSWKDFFANFAWRGDFWWRNSWSVHIYRINPSKMIQNGKSSQNLSRSWEPVGRYDKTSPSWHCNPLWGILLYVFRLHLDLNLTDSGRFCNYCNVWTFVAETKSSRCIDSTLEACNCPERSQSKFQITIKLDFLDKEQISSLNIETNNDKQLRLQPCICYWLRICIFIL